MKKNYFVRKRPCRICRKWFMPDPRVRDRQMTCGDKECKKKWHIKKCAEWNKKNSEYFKEIYLSKKLSASKNEIKQKKSDPNFHSQKLRVDLKLPRIGIQEVIGVQSLVIVEYITQLLLKRVQEVIRV